MHKIYLEAMSYVKNAVSTVLLLLLLLKPNYLSLDVTHQISLGNTI